MLKSIARSFLYYPEPELQGTPASVGLDYEDVWLQTADGVRVHAWFVPGNAGITWLWLHGNAGNVSSRLGNLRNVHHRLQVSVLLVSYRGYGLSQGEPGEEGTYEDARVVYRHLLERADVKPDRIVYFGRSLGAAVAARLAAEHPPAALVLESPFSSLLRLAPFHFPWMRLPLVTRVLPFRYDTAASVRSVTSPVLVIHGRRDDIVPVSLGREVFEAAREPREWFELDEAGHNDVESVGGDVYYRRLERFMRDHVR